MPSESMPTGWSTSQLGDLLQGGTRNGIYKPKEFHGRGAKMVNMGELFAYPRLGNVEMRRVELTEKELATSTLERGDLLFARRSLVAEGAGKCCLVLEVPEPTTFESSIIRGRPNPERADSSFLFYLFSSPLGRHLLGTILRHVAVAGITGSDLVELEVPVPPLPEQRAIAAVLGALDDKIDLNRRMNETLEAMARALFKSWFVDFGAVRAKVEGRAPAGMDAATAALFPDGFEESALEIVPRGWRHTPVLDVSDLISGGTPKTSIPAYWGGTINWASAKDVSQCGAFFLLNTERTITEAGVQNSSTKILPADCVVVVARGATCGRFTVLGSPMAMNQTCYALSARAPVGPWFLRFHAEGLLQRLVAQAHGSVFDTITTSTFEGARILVPTPPVLSAFEGAVTPLIERIRSSLKESATLATLRDALLPKLLSGELRVRDAEKTVEQVA